MPSAAARGKLDLTGRRTPYGARIGRRLTRASVRSPLTRRAPQIIPIA
jgi:hypothetical protein